ncbi:hypothetical protein FG386_001662 [Cryptosporidium ryanae]|uniref:uncharacterized protein n=1 Tax=Cryptosporidium ryanae TaxID=515981 RepID=UPI00351A2684|nr:hypothetical protein FG386_001662 [Cryptosporidium ryanae]
MRFKCIVVCGILNLIYTRPATYSLSFTSKLEEYVSRDIADIIMNSNPPGRPDVRCSLPCSRTGSSEGGPLYMKIHHRAGGTFIRDEYTISLVSTVINETNTTAVNETNSKSQHLDTNKNNLGTGILSPDITTRGHSVCRTNSTQIKKKDDFGLLVEPITANLMEG